MITKQMIKDAKKLAEKEIELNGTPILEHFELSNNLGQKLAKKLNADKNIVILGTILMDLKLGECFKEGKLEEHIKRSSDGAKNFLRKYDIDKKTKDKIINCIESHHGTKKFTCKEAEICANADCYRFIHPKGVFAYIKLLGKRFDDIEKVITQVVMKMEEKNKILSLPICKKELTPYYKTFKDLIKKARPK